MIRLDIEAELKIWRAVVKRQVDMTLSPVRDNLKSMRVRFRRVSKRRSGGMNYLCELSGKGLSGQRFEAVAQHTDGYVAIHDAFARIRRAITRDRQRRRQPGIGWLIPGRVS